MFTRRMGPTMGQPARPTQFQRMCSNAADSILQWNSMASASSSGQGDNITSKITVVCVSDTHGLQPALPQGDILIHAGDLTQKGTFDEIQAQLTWLSCQPHTHKFAIAGNHDLLLDEDFCSQIPHRDPSEPSKTRDDLDWGNVTYLRNSGCTIDVRGRQLRIWGSPLTPQFGTWAFQYPPIRDVWTNVVPSDTDILVTHGPPKLYLDDEGKGDGNLLKEIRRVKPMLVVFGHIHGGYGTAQLKHDGVHKAWEVVKLGHGGVMTVAGMFGQQLLAKTGMSSGGTTALVNAAVTQFRGGPKEPHLVQL